MRSYFLGQNRMSHFCVPRWLSGVDGMTKGKKFSHAVQRRPFRKAKETSNVKNKSPVHDISTQKLGRVFWDQTRIAKKPRNLNSRSSFSPLHHRNSFWLYHHCSQASQAWSARSHIPNGKKLPLSPYLVPSRLGRLRRLEIGMKGKGGCSSVLIALGERVAQWSSMAILPGLCVCLLP